MEEKSIVGLGSPDKPLHGLQDVLSGGDHSRVLLIVGEDDHILAAVPVALGQEGGQVLGVVDAAAQFSLLAEVVDSDQQGLAFPGAVGILEGVALRGTMAELLRSARRGRARAVGAAVSAVPRLVAPTLTVRGIAVRV